MGIFGGGGSRADGEAGNAPAVIELIDERLNAMRAGRRPPRGVKIAVWPFETWISPERDYVQVKLANKGLILALVRHYAALGNPIVFEPAEVMVAHNGGMVGNPQGYWHIYVYPTEALYSEHHALWASLRRDPVAGCQRAFADVTFAAHGR